MALFLLAANNAQSVLSAGISSTATTLTVNTGAGALFPSPVAGTSYFKLTLVDAPTGTITEIVHVTARTGDVMTITRAQEGTTARAWSANDIVANMMTAGTLSLLAQINQSLQIANNLGEIAAAGPAAIAATLANLGLKTAAQRDVGTGTNQIPDMTAFARSLTTRGHQIFPGGLIIQWGTDAASTGGVAGNGIDVLFDIPFTNACMSVTATFDNGGTAIPAAGASIMSNTYFKLRCSAASGTFVFRWIAVGF